MPKYFMNWSIVPERMPNDPKEIAAGWKMLTTMVHQELDHGTMKDWGAFPGDRRGYCIVEATPVEVMAMTTKYAPYVDFTTHPIATIGEVDEFLSKMAG